MKLDIELGDKNSGIQIVRTVVDTLRACNSACGYCYFFHKDFGKNNDFLPAKIIKDILLAANHQSQLDVVLSGGEITLHPEWQKLLDATKILDKTGVTLVTNGTTLDKKKVDQIKKSHVSRICISLDGATPKLHNYGRGNTFEKALKGLYELQSSGKNITVLSVLHKQNIDQILELSNFLAVNHLATQHHMAVPYYSGRARENYQKFIIPLEKVKKLQNKIDQVFDEYNKKGLYILFNHYWQLTGLMRKSGNPREFLSHQLGERNKATWAVVRCNGDVNSTTAYWGRESVNNPAIGNLFKKPAQILFNKLDKLYRSGTCRQLPREVESKYKYIVKGVFNKKMADIAISDSKKKDGIKLIPCLPMSDMEIMKTPIKQKYLNQMCQLYKKNQKNYRIIRHATNVYLFYDNTSAHTILLNDNELKKFRSQINKKH